MLHMQLLAACRRHAHRSRRQQTAADESCVTLGCSGPKLHSLQLRRRSPPAFLSITDADHVSDYHSVKNPQSAYSSCSYLRPEMSRNLSDLRRDLTPSVSFSVSSYALITENQFVLDAISLCVVSNPTITTFLLSSS